MTVYPPPEPYTSWEEYHADYAAAGTSERLGPTVTFAEFVALADETQREALVTAEQGTLLPAGGLGILAAKTGDGKTTLIVEFVLHAAAGLDYLGLSFPRSLNVLVIENEGPREAFREKLAGRLEHWEHEGSPRIWDVPAEWGAVRVSSAETREQLRAVVEEHKIDLVVSDSLTRFGVRGNGTPEETREFVEWLVGLGLGRDLAFLLLHHPRTRTEPGEDELERIAGAWPPHADLILLLKRLEGGRARLNFAKTRWACGQRPSSILAFDPERETFTFVSEDVPVERDLAAELAKVMADGDWWTVNQLRKSKDEGGVGARPEAIKQALAGERFESAAGDEIGERKGSTYYRIHKRHHTPGDARDASPLRPGEEEASPSPPRERGIGGDASSGRDAFGDADAQEVERLEGLFGEMNEGAS